MKRTNIIKSTKRYFFYAKTCFIKNTTTNCEDFSEEIQWNISETDTV